MIFAVSIGNSKSLCSPARLNTNFPFEDFDGDIKLNIYFPLCHTKYCLVKGESVEMPLRKRRFMMGNALVVNLVADMEKTLDKIFDNE